MESKMNGIPLLDIIQIVLAFSIAFPCTALALVGLAQRKQLHEDLE
jgi:hypothetical protein